MHFENKVVWITGASSGIGAALVSQLSEQGARIILTARNETALNELSASCKTETRVLAADLYQSQQLAGLVDQAIGAFGRIDIIIHAAGVSQRSLAEDTEEQVYRSLMEINFFAPVLITRHLMPHFRKNGDGHIVAIGSMAGLMGFPLRTGYSAAKHALKGWFESLQTEHCIPGLQITIIHPGRIRTPISMSALTGDGSPHLKMDKGQLNGIPLNICVDRIVKAIATKRRRLIIAGGERILWWLWFFIPNLYYSIARKKGMES